MLTKTYNAHCNGVGIYPYQLMEQEEWKVSIKYTIRICLRNNLMTIKFNDITSQIYAKFF